MKRRIPCIVALAYVSCAAAPKTAVVDGRTVPRPTLDFGGHPYSLRHQGAHPRPNGPSDGLTDAGGTITGRVCGMNVDYGVEHRGDHVLPNLLTCAAAATENRSIDPLVLRVGGQATDAPANSSSLYHRSR
jgi:hypothetical protein